MNLSGFIEIGILLKPHGFKGKIELKLDYPLKDNASLASFFLEDSPSPLPYFIEQFQNATGKFLIKLEDIDNLEDARSLKNKKVFCTENDFENYFELEDDKGFSNDFLIGLKLITQEKENLGEILDVFENTLGQKLLQLIIEDNEILIPFVEEQVIKIDESSNIIEYNVPDGLIEIYLNK